MEAKEPKIPTYRYKNAFKYKIKVKIFTQN